MSGLDRDRSLHARLDVARRGTTKANGPGPLNVYVNASSPVIPMSATSGVPRASAATSAAGPTMNFQDRGQDRRRVTNGARAPTRLHEQPQHDDDEDRRGDEPGPAEGRAGPIMGSPRSRGQR